MRAQSVGKCLKPPIDWNDQSQPESISVETFVHATVAKLKSLCCSEGASRLSKVRLSAFIRLGFPLHFAPCVCVWAWEVKWGIAHVIISHLWTRCKQQKPTALFKHLLAMLEDSCVHETSWVESNLRKLAVCKVWNPSFSEFVQVGDHTIEQNSKKPVPRI